MVISSEGRCVRWFVAFWWWWRGWLFIRWGRRGRASCGRVTRAGRCSSSLNSNFGWRWRSSPCLACKSRTKFRDSSMRFFIRDLPLLWICYSRRTLRPCGWWSIWKWRKCLFNAGLARRRTWTNRRRVTAGSRWWYWVGCSSCPGCTLCRSSKRHTVISWGEGQRICILSFTLKTTALCLFLFATPPSPSAGFSISLDRSARWVQIAWALSPSSPYPCAKCSENF